MDLDGHGAFGVGKHATRMHAAAWSEKLVGRLRGRPVLMGATASATLRDLTFSAIAQAPCRLARANLVRRLSRGANYRLRQTAFGESLPNVSVLQALASEEAPVFPAGLAAANLLGFTTQSPRCVEVSPTAASLPRALVGVSASLPTTNTWQAKVGGAA